MMSTRTCCSSGGEQYLEGAYGPPTLSEHAARQAEREMPPLLPVSIVAGHLYRRRRRWSLQAEPLETVCEVEFDRARLRIRGDVSPVMLRLLIRELSR